MKAGTTYKRKLWPLLIPALVLLMFSTPGCYYDKAEVLYPSTACDTANVTFGASVTPVLSSNCVACHGGASPSAGIRLDTYAGVKLQADNGRLLGAITHGTSFSPMPKNANKLSDCNIAKIRLWIAAGALNN
jgi:mono/diheme cytochrome c family protein